jgi:hypothetical protein
LVQARRGSWKSPRAISKHPNIGLRSSLGTQFKISELYKRIGSDCSLQEESVARVVLWAYRWPGQPARHPRKPWGPRRTGGVDWEGTDGKEADASGACRHQGGRRKHRKGRANEWLSHSMIVPVETQR